MAAAIALAASLASMCLEVAQNDDAAALPKLVDQCVTQQASMSRDLRPRTLRFKLDELFARSDRRWEELRGIGGPGGWSQSECAGIVEGCIEDLARLSVAMNSLNELVWGGEQFSAADALEECTGITGVAAQQLILVGMIALKVAKDTGASLANSVTHARYDFDTICSIGTACVRAYLDRAFPEPASIVTRPGYCRIQCQDPSGEAYFTSGEVPSGAAKPNPAFEAAMSAASSARRKMVSSEADRRVAGAGLTAMWAAARSLHDRRGPRRVAPREA